MNDGRGEDWQRGDWMQTFTGRKFWPTAARPEDLAVEDVAHALSLVCRYGGHVREFYSVAQHCVLVSRAAEPEHKLWALLHDATEAYVGDMVRPLKLQLPAYVEVEDRLMRVMCERWGLEWPMPTEVKVLDNRILLDERVALLGAAPGSWQVDGLTPLLAPDPLDPWPSARAEAEYLAAFRALVPEEAR